MKKLILFLLIAVMLSWTVPSWGETVKELKTKLQQSSENINNKKEQLDKVKDQKESIGKDIDKLDRQIDSTNTAIEELHKQIFSLDGSIEQKEEALKIAEEKMKELDELLETRIVALYKNGQTSYLELLLDANSISDFFARYQVVENILQYDKDLLNSTAKNKELIDQTKLSLERQKKEREEAKDSKLNTKKELDTFKGNKNVFLRTLNSKQRSIEAAIDEELRESEQIQESIKKIQNGSKRVYSGAGFQWPIDGSSRISSSFGYRMHPILKKKKLHTGIDIAAAYGTSIIAASSGTVISADWRGGYGKTVIIYHGSGKSTLYAHASRMLVAEGQEIKKGQKIAEVGSTGLSTGPHLHFEVRENGTPVDPLKYVSK